MGMLYKGLMRGEASVSPEATASTLIQGSGQALPPLGPVQPGSGVFKQDAPATASTAEDDAACIDCDVVLITVCSLRKDHLGAYGFDGDISPAVDTLAGAGIRFNRAYAASNFTLASLTAILTGRYGSATGVTGWDKGLTADVPTLAEMLGNYGYATGAFTTDAPSGFRPDYGLDRGFQHMEITPPPRLSPDGRYRGGSKEPLGSVAKSPVSWLAKQSKDSPVFLMMHTRTAHFPFVVDPPEDGTDPTGMLDLLWRAGQAEAEGRKDQVMPGMAGGTAQKGVVEIVRQDPLQARVMSLGAPASAVWSSAYAAGVTRMDADVAALLAAVEERGRPTIVILVADHGESLNDHGELLHGDAFFDGVVNVPLIFSVPGFSGAGSARDMVVSQTDILPTIAELVGAVVPAGVDGVSLVKQLSGSTAPAHAVVLSEGGVAKLENGVLPGAVISDPWILIKQRRGCGLSSTPANGVSDEGMALCLFNAETDPGQNRSVASAQPDVVEDLLSRWTGFRDAHGKTGAHRELSDAFIKELQRSGYDFSTGAP
jgi:arylsulfatase A-like enzyme